MRLISTLLVIILVLNFLIIQGLLAAGRLLEPSFYLPRLEESGLYDEAAQLITELAEEQLRQNNLPTEVLSGAVTRQWVAGQAEVVASGLLSYLRGETQELPVLDFDEPLARVADNTEQLLARSLGLPGLPGGELLNEFLQQTLPLYLRDIPFSPYANDNMAGDIRAALTPFKRAAARLVPTLQAAGVLSAVLLLLLFLPWRRGFRFLGWWGAALAGAGFPAALLLLCFLYRPGQAVLLPAPLLTLLSGPLASPPVIATNLALDLIRFLLNRALALGAAGLALLFLALAVNLRYGPGQYVPPQGGRTDGV